MSEENTINVSFDLRPKTLSVLADLLSAKLTALRDADPTTVELWNMLNVTRSTLQHYVAAKVKAEKLEAEKEDWL